MTTIAAPCSFHLFVVSRLLVKIKGVDDAGLPPRSQTIYFYTANPNKKWWRFSNFAHLPVTIGGHTFTTSEHYFQYKKFARSDAAYALVVRDAPTPYECKKLSNSREHPIDAHWDEMRLDVMREALLAKALQWPLFRQDLLSTGRALLVEDSPYDNFWGCGRNKKGQNWLGRLLVELRSVLCRAGNKIYTPEDVNDEASLIPLPFVSRPQTLNQNNRSNDNRPLQNQCPPQEGPKPIRNFSHLQKNGPAAGNPPSATFSRNDRPPFPSGKQPNNRGRQQGNQGQQQNGNGRNRGRSVRGEYFPRTPIVDSQGVVGPETVGASKHQSQYDHQSFPSGKESASRSRSMPPPKKYDLGPIEASNSRLPSVFSGNWASDTE